MASGRLTLRTWGLKVHRGRGAHRAPLEATCANALESQPEARTVTIARRAHVQAEDEVGPTARPHRLEDSKGGP
jgi:hypothetical protein